MIAVADLFDIERTGVSGDGRGSTRGTDTIRASRLGDGGSA